MSKDKISIFWFRRDLRLDDNRGLQEALKGEHPVVPIFIFDNEITDELDANDPRVTFIYETLNSLSSKLNTKSSGIYCKKGAPLTVWKNILSEFNVQAVFANEDYEPLCDSSR